MLRDLQIENYRLFRKFSLDRIGRVNLIVGTNNCGKSSLLEAIYIHAGKGHPRLLTGIMDERGEFVVGAERYRYERVRFGGYQICHLFHGHRLDAGLEVKISATQDTGKVAVLSMRLKRRSREWRQIKLFGSPSEGDEIEEGEEQRVLLITWQPGESVKIGPEVPITELPISDEGLYPDRGYSFRPHPRWSSEWVRFLTTSYLGYDELALLWDGITLTPKEDRVVEALQILEPDVRRISFTSRQTSNSGILLKLEGREEPVPLGSMGDGMRRVLGLIASLVTVEDGVLLVDEIDTGLYYGALTDMWRMLLETATRLNVQVFATTHSLDCVRSFQEALESRPEDDLGLLIRLERDGDDIRAIVYTGEELAIAVQQGIEVR